MPIDPTLDSVSGGTQISGTASKHDVWSIVNNPEFPIWGLVTITVNFSGVGITMGMPLPLEIRDVNERMLKEEVGADAVILAEGGVPIRCHKSFLMVHSPVFREMFETNMMEGDACTVYMTYLTEAQVHNFLEYLYCSETTEAENNCEVALVLLEAGHKYHIKELEESMKEIFLYKLRP